MVTLTTLMSQESIGHPTLQTIPKFPDSIKYPHKAFYKNAIA